MSEPCSSTSESALLPTTTPLSPAFSSAMVITSSRNLRILLLVGRVADDIVQFLPRLHAGEQRGLGSFLPELPVGLLDRLERDAERGHGEDDHPIAERLQLRSRQQRRFPELGHVGEQRRLHLPREFAEFLL